MYPPVIPQPVTAAANATNNELKQIRNFISFPPKKRLFDPSDVLITRDGVGFLVDQPSTSA